MVSNDDVDFTRVQSRLQNIKDDEDTAIYAEHIFIVPSGKKWNLIAAYIVQGTSDLVQIFLHDTSTPVTSIEIWNASASNARYTPDIKMTLPAGWKVVFNYKYTTVRWMKSSLLVEEEPEY